MKKIFIILLSFISCILPIFAEHTNEVCITVALPKVTENYNTSNLEVLGNKMKQIITANGFASDSNLILIMYPSIDAGKCNIVEGGMKNIFNININVTFYIKAIGADYIINSTNIALTGSGYSKEEAFNNAFSSISTNSLQLSTFVKEGQSKLFSYFNENRSFIISKAQTLSSLQKYDEALGLLSSCPQNCSAYKNGVKQAIISIYKQYQNKECSQLLNEAKAYYVAKDYQSAIRILSTIDQTSSCKAEGSKLLVEIKKQIRLDDKASSERLDRIYKNETDLEKARINAVREIAKAYYRRKIAINYILF